MSATAATLKCPICLHTGAFNSAEDLKDRLILVSTNKITCPVCQEEVIGIDKLTIHLFTHLNNLVKEKVANVNEISDKEVKSKYGTTQSSKKIKINVTKNKPSSPQVPVPVKYVKIYPKLPVVSVNSTLPTTDLSQTSKDSPQYYNPYVQAVKCEGVTVPNDTICNVCGLQFVDKNILKMHRCLIHNIEENDQVFTRYNCHLCSKNFKMRGSLMVHLRVAHYGFSSGQHASTSTTENCDGSQTNDKVVSVVRHDNKQWQCDVCLKCFTTKYFLKKHKRLHTGETPYSCSKCNKTFTFQQSYHKHLLYHNDEKPHVCSYCGRAFKELSTLHNHQRIHTGEKPFSCETCGKCFRQRVSYLVHKRIHTGVMPYKCTACEKSFRYKVSQRTHKCQAQPPGKVIRQSGDLVEKLKKKTVNDNVNTVIPKENNDFKFLVPVTHEVSEANAELVRCGARLSLEDTESDNFILIADAFKENSFENQMVSEETYSTNNSVNDAIQNYQSSSDELFDKITEVEHNVPSPSEILKKLCLSKDEDPNENGESYMNYELFKEFL